MATLRGKFKELHHAEPCPYFDLESGVAIPYQKAFGLAAATALIGTFAPMFKELDVDISAIPIVLKTPQGEVHSIVYNEEEKSLEFDEAEHFGSVPHFAVPDTTPEIFSTLLDKSIVAIGSSD